MIETETTSPHRNPVPWLTPMVVMWGSVIIVIALIVLGTWLNKRKAEFDTHEAREKFEAVLREAKFTPQQAEALTKESEAMLASAGVGIARREAATRWFHRMEQSLACVAFEKKLGELDVFLSARLASPASEALLRQWAIAKREAHRMTYAIDRADADPEDATKWLNELFKSRETITPAQVDEFAADCRKIADEEKAPQDPPAFDLYESLRAGIVESKSDGPAHVE